MNTFNFNAKLEQSEISTETIKAILFPHLKQLNPVSIERACLEEDLKGIDYKISFLSGETLNLDLKYRPVDKCKDQDTKDVALELWSSLYRKEGWSIDDQKKTHLIMFFYGDTGRLHIFSFKKLKRACKKYLEEWSTIYLSPRQKSSFNGRTWISECVFVPVDVLKYAMNEDSTKGE